MKKNKFYLSTAIAYVNARPHIGHALEFVVADAIARFKRLQGDDTFFLTGTDEHGVKIFRVAQTEGLSGQKLVDKNVEYFKEMVESYEITADDFIRTSEERHKRGAVKLWQKLVATGDIYKKSYSGLYCAGCESFVLEKDLVEGRCSQHLKEPELVEEENYFFKLSKYSKEIERQIVGLELKVYPEARKNEILALLKEGLKDVSFSRPSRILPWGIPVPDDDSQVMYVWCDALTNYISALGYGGDEEKMAYWPCDLHIIGKDILRFHAGVWIGMLLSAGLPLPKAIGVHGFVTSEGVKMSKSLGNVVDPMELLERFSVDAVRFYLLREVPTTEDGDFSEERFKVVYQSDLANNFGNFASRVIGMTGKYFEGKVPQGLKYEFEEEFQEMYRGYIDNIEDFDLKKAIELILQFLHKSNQYVEEMCPWILAKEGQTELLSQVLFNLLESLKRVVVLLHPFVPQATEYLAEVLQIDLKAGFENLFTNLLGAERELVIAPIEPLFRRD